MSLLCRIAVFCSLICSVALTAESLPNAWIQQIVGSVEVSSDSADWKPAAIKSVMNPGDVVRTGPSSWAVVAFPNASLVRIEAGSTVRLRDIRFNPKKGTIAGRMDLQGPGRVTAFIRKLGKESNHFNIGTPVCVVGVRGTAFEVEVPDNDSSRFTVWEGKVIVRDFVSEEGLSVDNNEMMSDFLHEIILGSGQGAEYRKGKGFSKPDSSGAANAERRGISDELRKASDELASSMKTEGKKK
jgi:ferric-dicitrate binding protein FerR (iron transport regulator)